MKIAYVEAGHGTPLVLLHAFPLTASMWAAQLEGLSDHCRLIAPDQRGFGASPPVDEAEPDLGAVAEDLRELLDTLGLDRVVLGGVSMGGYVAFQFLRRYPARVAGLLLADTRATPDAPAAAANRHRIADAVLAAGHTGLLASEVVPNLLGDTTRWQRPDLYETVADQARRYAPEAVAWTERAMAARADSTDLLAAITVPTLVVVGEQDVITPPEEVEAMAAAVPGAVVRLFPAAGHLTPLEAPERFNAAVRSLLSRL